MAILAFVLALGSALTWFFAARLSPPSEPPWTLADPPVPPAEEGNAWSRVGDLPRSSPIDAHTDERLSEILDPDVPLEERLATYERAAGALRIESEEADAELDARARAIERALRAD